ncbi:hypothetical protein FZI85_19855 [Mycobacterium sp. CBMA293]|uniref:hypothetical protein n=1 Tax=unclassified Mycolicibacterium TaxID=2636767 RepID=UPI0012DC32B3|nr:MULTISPECIES: hypothetical protein [unclassified Mycolicibacterium]MUL49049.1 hypothetical protein [Mycolicibacterium sp. CBMA 360]MUL60937.1 hypothetical protein [Mycolicibacterium sp. CBMA 335]MUL71950.1 hypothetical protein [Mycolicibacterium sp. CBMA 311]MUL95878.1 hypothetical protein [Mycolicibacterium sp. CBMA 230]MUM09027.1 hypothetical protein [Mycolicibacterium sp. CBMA 213]
MTNHRERRTDESEAAAAAQRADTDHGSISTIALAWFRAEDFEQALLRWKDFAESDLIVGPDGPLPHSLYCRAFQQRLAMISEAGTPDLRVAPVRVAQFTTWCSDEGQQQPARMDTRPVRAHLASRHHLPGRLLRDGSRVEG